MAAASADAGSPVERLKAVRSFLSSVRHWLGSSSAVAPQIDTLVFDGDSIAAGSGALPGFTLADHVARLLPFRGKPTVVALPGSPVSERNTLFADCVAPLHDAKARRNVIFFHAGDNDVAMGVEPKRSLAS